MNTTRIEGTVAPGFEFVRDEFAAFAQETDGQTGSQLAAYDRGRLVVDLWTGDGTEGDTLTGVHSVTKGATSLVMALLVQDGLIDLDLPVARYWPEFGQAGKAAITVREVMTHHSGVIGIPGGFTVEELVDERLVADRLAAEAPLWRPGTAHGYAAFTVGALLNAVVSRATGQTVQEVYSERVREPYGLDFHLGLPEALEPRYRPIRPWTATPEQEAAFAAHSPNPDGIAGMGYNLGRRGFTPQTVMTFPNARNVRAAGPASAGGVASARGIAKLYAAMIGEIDGRAPLLTSETLAEFTSVHATGTNLVTGDGSPFALGFEAKGLIHPFLSARAFGHTGSAGSDGIADPLHGIAIGYTRSLAAFAFDAPERARFAAAIASAAGPEGKES
ncbi:serine hydrolase domain-containing protein [Glycomyces algeriensis]|uniref:Serine hydrolase n=1 Tax=Glycomyces algeriensis TaxID=256037 RepID=A0A9W6LGI3_9ACTN|nr:serine hydrolase domain-containing protein [Glycomyces algeriensis]MDA1364279.1 serine hydrolase [Glycomyces algeriensis]MDR7350309.1 CubicO group peptidase (beta-lactamase class C family) [Glycomyces algeriensis]GLI43017.1 serine hydrolase [Glycomyces algeriensis]